MATWNYRLVQRRDGSFGLHEVFYHASGVPRAMTETAVSFAADAEEGAAGVIASLEMALRDVRTRPLMIEDEAFPVRSDEP